MRAFSHSLFTILAVLGAAAGGYQLAYQQFGTNIEGVSKLRCTLRTNLRKLWSDHVMWIRNYMIAAVAESPDAQPAADRLLKNQEDLGNAFIPYYGKEAAQKFTRILKEHISLATEVIAAAKAGNQAKLKESDQKWHLNALELADFLSEANPHWSKDALIKMLNAHLTLITEETSARLSKNWKDDIINFDKSFEQILDMSDQLTAGIAQQFPHKF